MRQISVIAAIALIIVGALAYNFLSNQRKPAERIPPTKAAKLVKSALVKNATVPTEIEITGRLIALNRIEVFAEVGGVLLPTKPDFKEGNYFKKGNPLIKIDDDEHQLDLLAQKSNFQNQITLMLPDLKSDYTESFPNWEAYLRELEVEEELEKLPEPLTDQEQYYVSARNIYNLFYSIKRLEERSTKYTIVAPFNGIVVESNINEGTLIRVGQKLGEFIDPYNYELEAAVNEFEIDFIKIGDEVDMYSEKIKGSWKGTVSRISSRIDPNTQTVKVFIRTSGKDLREGMYLSAKIKGETIKNAYVISRDLLLDDNQIYIIKDSTLVLQPVEPIYASGNSLIVKGLEDGTNIMAENITGAYNGLKIQTYVEEDVKSTASQAPTKPN